MSYRFPFQPSFLPSLVILLRPSFNKYLSFANYMQGGHCRQGENAGMSLVLKGLKF